MGILEKRAQFDQIAFDGFVVQAHNAGSDRKTNLQILDDLKFWQSARHHFLVCVVSPNKLVTIDGRFVRQGDHSNVQWIHIKS